MAYDLLDQEIRRFIVESRPARFSDLQHACAAKFGLERTWPLEVIIDAWIDHHADERGQPSRFEADAEVMDFIGERGGLISLDKILKAGVALFGKDRFPSRSHLFRLIPKARQRLVEISRQKSPRTSEATDLA